MTANSTVVVLRGASAARFPQDRLPLTIGVPTARGSMTLTYRTRYSEEGFEDPIPREMYVDVRLSGDWDLDAATNAALFEANKYTPAIAVATNAFVGDLDAHLAFDATPGVGPHTFFENFLPDESGRPRHGRGVDVEATVSLIESVEGNDETPRLVRAMAQYREALAHWRKGRETFVVSHLWMSVEALTKAAVRSCMRRENCANEEALAVRWGLPTKKGLDGEARRRVIFHGDTDCYDKTKTASDGFEHGFMRFDELYQLAADVRDQAATHVRRAILELAELPPDVLARLAQSPFEKVRASWPLVMYVRGELHGEVEALAASDQEYPLLRWEARVKSLRRGPHGTAEMEFDNNMTFISGEGTTFTPQSIEMWGPESDPRPN